VVKAGLVNVQSGIGRAAPRQFLLVLGRGVASVLGLWIFARQCSGATVCLEVLRSTLIAANLHNTKLVPLPNVQVRRSYERDVHAHISMIRRAVEAEVNAKGYG
jgi:hypothetical protein